MLRRGGRWISYDPANESASINLKVPCRNNLISKTDILGLWDKEFVAITFIPTVTLYDPAGTVFSGDGQPGNFEASRKSYRTYHRVRVKLNGHSSSQPQEREIFEEFKDTGITTRWRSRSHWEHLFSSSNVRTIWHDTQQYFFDRETKADPSKQTRVELINVTTTKTGDGAFRICSLDMEMHANGMNPLGANGSPAINYHWELKYGDLSTLYGMGNLPKMWISKIRIDHYPSYIFAVDGGRHRQFDAMGSNPLKLFGDADDQTFGPIAIRP